MKPDDSPMKIIAIIVNWQRPKDTIECIQSLLATNHASLKILVVDNGSNDDSIAQFEQAFPTIDILPLNTNLGFAGGYNAGIEHGLKTDATHFFILNNDTIVDEDIFQNLGNHSWDMVIPKIVYYADPKRIWAAGAKWRSFPPSVIMNGFGQIDNGDYDSLIELDYATGCALLTKRDVWEAVKGFDIDFISYMEDYELCYRVKAAGYSIGYAPKAIVHHKVSLTLGEGSSQKSWYLGRNTVLFYRKESRFPRWNLWSFIGWTIIRLSLKGKINAVIAYGQGVFAGWKFLRSKRYNNR